MPTFQQVYATEQLPYSIPTTSGDLVGLNGDTAISRNGTYKPQFSLPGTADNPNIPTTYKSMGVGEIESPYKTIDVEAKPINPNQIAGDVPKSSLPGASSPKASLPPANADPWVPPRGGSVSTAAPSGNFGVPKMQMPPGLVPNIALNLALIPVGVALGSPIGGAIGSGVGGIVGGVLGNAILPGFGGAVGAAVGSIVGGMIGNAIAPTPAQIPGGATPGGGAPIPVDKPPNMTSDGLYKVSVPYKITSLLSEGTANAPYSAQTTGAHLQTVLTHMLRQASSSNGYTTNSPLGVSIEELEPGTQPMPNPYPNNTTPSNPDAEPTPAAPISMPKPDSNPKPANPPTPIPIPLGIPGSPVPQANPMPKGQPAPNPDNPPKPTPPLLPVPTPNPTPIPAPNPVPQANPLANPSPKPQQTSPGSPLPGLGAPGTGATTSKTPGSSTTATPGTTPEYKPETPAKTPTPPTGEGDKCCKSHGDDLAVIKKILGISEFPANLPILTGDEFKSINNIPQLILWVVQNIDAVTGLFPIKIEALQGSGSKATLELENMSHAIQELFAMCLTIAQDCDAGVNIGARIATEIINTKVKATQGNELLQALIKWTGIAIAPTPKTIKLNFTPSAAGANNKLENDEMEEFLKPSEKMYVGNECAEKDQLLPIVNRVLQNTEISRASVWHPIKPTGTKGDNFIGMATSKANKKASKAEDKRFSRKRGDKFS
jgi:hypothetical protein